jgi:putative toxin-antitoxin system antitoxin component (TIGR02293 family)
MRKQKNRRKKQKFIKPLMAGKYVEEARQILVKRSGRSSRFLDAISSKNEESDLIGPLGLGRSLHVDTKIMSAYQAKLQLMLPILSEATGQDIYKLIRAGFTVGRMELDRDAESLSTLENEIIISLKVFKKKSLLEQPLSAGDCKYLFRIAHILAMASAVFGSDIKARSWLSKPKRRFLGRSPIEMLSTCRGKNCIEEMLIQLAHGNSL